jgi:lipopolysaccharide/colanic/teichoic acid biosynthesis glycosyltransferase
MYRKFGKRTLDVAGAFVGLVATMPVMLAVAVALSIAGRGTPLFLQRRPGRHGKMFTMIKFKTMNDRRDAAGELLPAAERIHPLGRLLRATSIDELPQMFNVLRGEMSFIGPRPLLEEYLPLYDPRQARRHEVRPGMTGLAQVTGRNALSWEERFECDVRYVDGLSLRLDATIAARTILKLFRRGEIDPDLKNTIPFDVYRKSLTVKV